MDYIMIGRRIRLYRRQKDLTQEQLAELVGVSASFMGHIEGGCRVASIETLMKLNAALNVTPNELLSDEVLIAAMELPERVSVSPRELLQSIAMLLRAQENP